MQRHWPLGNTYSSLQNTHAQHKSDATEACQIICPSSCLEPCSIVGAVVGALQREVSCQKVGGSDKLR